MAGFEVTTEERRVILKRHGSVKEDSPMKRGLKWSNYYPDDLVWNR
jgi:hypothetical protein